MNAPSASSPQPKPWIAGLSAYVPGKAASDDGKPLIKLSANENPLGASEHALAALAAMGDQTPPQFYPDPDARELRAAIAEVHGLDPARVVCGTGSDELLHLAALGYAAPGDEIVYVRYGFSVYPIAARRVGAEAVVAPDKDYGTDVDALLACVSERTRVVFVANPNNPTGTFLEAGEMKRLHAGLPADVLLVIDQAYGEYLDGKDDGGLALAEAYDNVLVTRTFSKIYGLAGERIGWGTAAPAIVDVLNRIRAPFNVTRAGQVAALAAVRDQDHVARSRDHNAHERARFVERIAALDNFGLRCVPSEANFVLVLFEGALQADTANAALAAGGYAVRHLPKQGLANALRITIGTREQMDDVLRIIEHEAREAGA